MNFSLPRVFVSPVSNTIPTTGTTSNLTANELGIYLPNNTPATAGNIGAADYFYIAQGRPDTSLNLRTIKSDKIVAKNVIEKYLVTGSSSVNQQVGVISDIIAHCGEQLVISIRAFSQDIDAVFSNGLTRSIVLETPCCDCDTDPCEVLTPGQIEELVDEAVLKINSDPVLGKYIVASKTDDVEITLTGIAQPVIENCDLTANGFRYDAVVFQAWVYAGAFTTQDFANLGSCEESGVYETTQEISFPKGTTAQVLKEEINNHSYKVPAFKQIYADPGFNGLFNSNAQEGTLYDQFYIKVNNPESPNTWSAALNQDFTVIIYTPQAQTAAWRAILEEALGVFEEK